jgi:membrane fusion protein, heavy metal efflux system
MVVLLPASKYTKMKFKWMTIALIAAIPMACHHSHDGSGSTQHAGDHHGDDSPKIQYTAYSDDFELFAEADVFVVGHDAGVLAHFSTLPDFRALEQGAVTMILSVEGKEVRQELKSPTRKGIYKFQIEPVVSGKGFLRFEFSNGNIKSAIKVPEVHVFRTPELAAGFDTGDAPSETNTVVFTKEQSWKVEFATGYPSSEPFGQVIRTAAVVQPAQGRETLVTAKTTGVAVFDQKGLLEGMEVKAGQKLLLLSASGLVDNNPGVKYSEAKNNYEKAMADYERAKELANQRIVSDKELLQVKNQYENAAAVYENFRRNFSPTGQVVTSPQAGFVRQVFVRNGSFVEAGQPILTVSQSKFLNLTAEVNAKYAPVLKDISTATIRLPNERHAYTLEELNGKVVSYGMAVSGENFLIPVHLQVENNGYLVPGSFVEVNLRANAGENSLVVPNTALLEEQGVFFVWVQVHPELFEKREVTIGATDGKRTEIKHGIDSNDRIVTRGAILIRLAQATGGLDAHSGHVH